MRRYEVRDYRSGDASGTFAVFVAAVTVTASADYSTAQIAAWSRPEERDLVSWDRTMSERHSFVAVVDREIVGFSDVSADGHIDMMFVAPQHTRQGVARRLLAALEAHARSLGVRRLSADVSVTARPFFTRHGFLVEAEQHPVIGDVQMINYRMTKVLTDCSM